MSEHDHDHHDHDHDHISEADSLPDAPNGAEAEAGEDGEGGAGHGSLKRALNLSFVMLKGFMLVILVLFCLDCAQQLRQNEIGLVRRFGRFAEDGAGLVRKLEPGSYHFILPEPIEKLERVSLSNRSLSLDAEFWTSDGAGARRIDAAGMPANRESFDPDADGYNLTGDLNLIHTRWKIEYAIDRNYPQDYLLATVPAPAGTPAEKLEDYGPEKMLRSVAASVILRNIAGLSADDVLINKQSTLKSGILEQIQQAMRDPQRPGRHLGGLVVTNALLAAVSPPARVKVDFDQVAQAMAERQTAIDDAERDAKDILEKAGAEAAGIAAEGTVLRRRIVETAKAEAGYVQDLADRFKDDPGGLAVMLEQLRLDALDKALGGASLTTFPPRTPDGGRHVIQIVPAQEAR